MTEPERLAREIVIKTLQKVSIEEDGPRADMARMILLEMSIEQAQALKRSALQVQSAFVKLGEQMAMAVKPLSEFVKEVRVD